MSKKVQFAHSYPDLPSAPAAEPGRTLVYTRNKALYYVGDDGVEHAAGGAGGAAPANMVTTDTTQTITADKIWTSTSGAPLTLRSPGNEGVGLALGRNGLSEAYLGLEGTAFNAFSDGVDGNVSLSAPYGKSVQLGVLGSGASTSISTLEVTAAAVGAYQPLHVTSPNPGTASASLFLDNGRTDALARRWEFYSDAAGNFGVWDKTRNQASIVIGPASLANAIAADATGIDIAGRLREAGSRVYSPNNPPPAVAPSFASTYKFGTD